MQRCHVANGAGVGYVSDKWQHAQRTGLYLSEDEARFYFRQFITAVAYCHGHSVAHRCTAGPVSTTPARPSNFDRFGSVARSLQVNIDESSETY